jgi:phosphoribosylformylglycinamidine synthase
MSGTFEHISVPPTLIAFGITTVKADKVVSPELKKAGNKLYLIKHNALANYMPNVEQLKENWTYTTNMIQAGKICAGYAIGFGGVAEAIAKMSFGNELAANITLSESDLFDYNYGSILVEATEELTLPAAQYLGTVVEGRALVINGEQVSREVLLKACCGQFDKIYPSAVPAQHKDLLPAGLSILNTQHSTIKATPSRLHWFTSQSSQEQTATTTLPRPSARQAQR